MDCIFCNISAGTMPAKKEYEDADVVAFYDIHPSAPVHLLVIPKKHIQSVDAITADDMTVIGKVHKVAGDLAKKLQLTDGYKVVANGGRFQEVKHIHYHLLSGFTNPGVNI